MKKSLFLLPLALLLTHFLPAQSLPVCPVDTPPADYCPDACLYCNLDGYHGTTGGYTGQTPPGFCGTIENEQWFGFVAIADSATITATPANCSNGDGIQLALYTDCASNPVVCNGGNNGGGTQEVAISTPLLPGTTYYLMVDGWAGDQCEFTLHVDPPGAAQGNVTVKNITVCPDQTYTINGVAYTAPNSIPITFPGTFGNCDSIVLYNLLEAPVTTIVQQFELCQNESVVIDGVEYFAPDTVFIELLGSTDCDTILEYDLLYKPPSFYQHTIIFCPGESVNLLGTTYFEPATVLDTIQGMPFCDTIHQYNLIYTTDPADCPSCSKTWMKVIGQEGQDVRGYGIYDAPDGNFYVTGAKQDSALIMNVDVAGHINWSFCFDISPGQNDNIAEIITDADGMLAGAGQSGDSMPGLAGFAFRLDPATQTMLWTRVFDEDAPFVNGILSLEVDHNYLLYFNQNAGANNAGLLKVNKSDGALLASPLSKRINVGLSDDFRSVVQVNGEFYCIGHFSNTSSANNRRSALTRLNTFGDVAFSSVNHLPYNSAAQLSGADLLFENNSTVSIAYGNDNGSTLSNSQIFMYKHLPSGTLQWAKRIDLQGSGQEVADEIISVPDGYILYGHSLSASGDLYLIKTDKNGVYQWSKQLDYGPNDHFQTYSAVQSQILERNGYLFFTATTTDSSGRSSMLLLKTTADATLDGNCDFITDIPANLTSISNPTNTFPPGFVPFSVPLLSEMVTTSVVPTPLNNRKACGVFTTLNTELGLCPGESFVVGGIAYTAPAVVSDTLLGNAGCDTIISLTLVLQAATVIEDTIEFCPGESVSIHGTVYSGSGTVTDTLPASVGCDTILIHHLVMLSNPVRSETIEFCPGTSVSIGGNVYSQPGIVTDTLPAGAGCDTIVTYNLVQLANTVRSETIEFCPGTSVSIGGNVYSQPGIVMDTLPAGAGCDTIVTYHLQFATTPNSSVSIICPANISQVADPGSGLLAVHYAAPAAQSDCECPGIAITLTQGPAPGELFAAGTTKVCYLAKDSCGNTAECCFNVEVEETSACDVKVIGCMKYELLSITKESGGSDYTYRIRVTNNCASKLIYTAIQLPSGVAAVKPVNNSVYTAPSGRTYNVRNPNYSPFYSMRFKSGPDSIANGQSDILEYVIPGQVPPAYIHITSRLVYQAFYEAHLNTFFCPVGVTPLSRSSASTVSAGLRLFPNPTNGALFVDLSDWEDQNVQLRILDSRGKEVAISRLKALNEPQEAGLDTALPDGLYFMEISLQNGERHSARFIVQR